MSGEFLFWSSLFDFLCASCILIGISFFKLGAFSSLNANNAFITSVFLAFKEIAASLSTASIASIAAFNAAIIASSVSAASVLSALEGGADSETGYGTSGHRQCERFLCGAGKQYRGALYRLQYDVLHGGPSGAV